MLVMALVGSAQASELPPDDDDIDGVANQLEGDVDTDGDGAPDRLDPDSDADGLPDALEDKDGDGRCQPWETDRIDVDTDDDGLSDAEEDRDRDGVFAQAETSPIDPDTDDDGILDGDDACPLVHAPAWPDGCAHEPGEGDGTPTTFSDRDGDGLSDGFELATGCLNPDDPDTDGDSLGDARDPHFCDPFYSAHGTGCGAVPGGKTGAEVLLLVGALFLASRIRRAGCSHRH
jgi:hypothetical protein